MVESVIMGTADLLSDVILHQPMKTATAQHLEETR